MDAVSDWINIIQLRMATSLETIKETEMTTFDLNDEQFRFSDLRLKSHTFNRKGFKIIREPKEEIIIVSIIAGK